MAITNPLLRVLYGSGTLPTAGNSTQGSMYVVTGTSVSNGIYDAALYFDLDNKRYQIQATEGNHVANALKLQLNGTQLGNAYNGASEVTWNIPLAAANAVGLMSTGAQTFAGAKTFNGAVTLKSTLAVQGTTTAYSVNPAADNTYTLGSSTSNRWKDVYAVNFHGALDGNATTATTADKVAQALIFQDLAGTQTESYNGSGERTITLSDLVAAGQTIPVSMLPAAALERIFAYADQAAAQTALNNGDIQAGDLVQIGTSGIMYYVKETTSGSTTTLSLEEFTAGVASVADHVGGVLSLSLGNSAASTYNGSSDLSFNIPYATNTVAGILSTSEQVIGGAKTFNAGATFASTITANGAVAINATTTAQDIVSKTSGQYNLGSSSNLWNNVYANTFVGYLNGKAKEAGYLTNALIFSSNATGFGAGSYNGSGEVTIGTFVPSTASQGGSAGFVPGPAANQLDRVLRSDGTWSQIIGGNGITVSKNGSFTISHSNAVTERVSYLGTSSDKTIDLGDGGSFVIPAIKYDAQGHITAATGPTITIGALDIDQELTSGLHVATIEGVEIYSGVEWGTF